MVLYRVFAMGESQLFLQKVSRWILVLCAAVGFAVPCFGQGTPSPLKAEFIYPIGSTSFPSSHASTIVELKHGNFIAAWFGGTSEGNSDVAIWGSRLVADKWSAPVELVREPEIACWNPVLFHTNDGKLWLYYKFGSNPGTWAAGRRYSTDEGMTWSLVEHLPAGLLGPIRAKPLVLSDGTIVSGSSIEAYHTWAAWIERSSDGGKTWAKIGPITLPADTPVLPPAKMVADTAFVTAGATDVGVKPIGSTFGIIQPSVVSLGGRHLRLYARSTTNVARVSVADSYDNGLTWTQAHTLEISNPNSGIDAVALRDSRIVLIYNNSTTLRTPLNLAVSEDGEHFCMFATLEDQPGQYSYPAMIQGEGGDLRITYTYQRKTIKYVRFPLANIPK